ncbi:MAG TPA: hypothetical protein VFA70_05030 [Dehalococcoidia bacterium]|jgi:hypothetical protein|nr:hypothetical protein [Dehalococcoidia bacterium]
MSTITDALLIRDDNGVFYAIPRDLLERCRVEQPTDEVQGYLNPQPLPPGRSAYSVLGFSPVAIRSGGDLGNPAAPLGITLIGR